MASSNPLSTRLEELRSRNPQSPPTDSVHSGYTTPTRYSGSFMNSRPLSFGADSRALLQRRLTADSNNTPPSVTPNGFPPPQGGMESIDMTANTIFKVQALERKRQELEKTREQRRRLDAQLEALNRQEGMEVEEYHAQVSELGVDMQSMQLQSPGHQSEPTTPPEYRDSIYANMYSRRNRYSSMSLVSPPNGAAGVNGSNSNRISRSGSQITSPPPESLHGYQNGSDEDKLPSKSVPASRRGSTDKFSSYLPEGNVTARRSFVRNNRYSMPVTSKRESVPETSAVSNMGMGPLNTTSFLFDDDEKQLRQRESATSPDVNTYLQMNTNDDKFPILVRNNQKPGVLSASSAALDLALLNSAGDETQSNGWPQFGSHRNSQQSLSQMVFDAQTNGQQGLSSPTGSSHLDGVLDSPTKAANRHSMEASIASLAPKGYVGANGTNGNMSSRPGLAGLSASFSTNDIPTLKSNPAVHNMSAQPTHAEKHFHNHNASMGRIPVNGMHTRISRDLGSNAATGTIPAPIAGADAHRDDAPNGLKALQSDLQATATPFGPTTSAGSPTEPVSGVMAPAAIQAFANPAFYGGYGMQMMGMGLNPLQMNGLNGMNAPFAAQMASLYQGQINPYAIQQAAAYNQMANGGRGFQETSPVRAVQPRRPQSSSNDEGRYHGTKLEQWKGDVYSMCKDQNGCRFLQRQLETRKEDTLKMIFIETHQHVVELMTDPFGNYLCQKMLEHCEDGQRTVLVNSAASQMVKIALNQHGTRALQKMIEYLSTPEQIQTVIAALKDHVVELIQDLNGNHVVQKCLNRLSTDDFQFIFESIGTYCVVVGTHRHGCCVIQRCIDHGTGQQKTDLIAQITANAMALVQDPYGNYVVQYIIDLNDPTYTNPICYSFQSHIPSLSKHKFSSNVIEKCLRHADPAVASSLIEEMLHPSELERMLRDSYANYVVQTALDTAEPDMRQRLVDLIRPLLPQVRHTPYGRRLQSKVCGDGPGAFTNGGDGPRRGSNGHNGHNGGYSGTSHRPQGMYGGPGPNGFGPQSFGPGHGCGGMNGHGPRGNNGNGHSHGPYNSGRNGPYIPPAMQGFARGAQANGFNNFF